MLKLEKEYQVPSYSTIYPRWYDSTPMSILLKYRN